MNQSIKMLYLPYIVAEQIQPNHSHHWHVSNHGNRKTNNRYRSTNLQLIPCPLCEIAPDNSGDLPLLYTCLSVEPASLPTSRCTETVL